ncbi:MAG: DUF1995 family protein [Desertifilum sp. SIO1I2]|nr:DUF1995 family protein [Desertifilum sp. SIO1I2]
MTELPKTLDDAIAQAQAAMKVALDEGCTLLQIELVFPEIALQAQSIAQQFIPFIQELGVQPTVFFPDAGAAALARRDWGEIPFRVTDLGSSRSPVEKRIQPDDQFYLVVSPAAVEVAQVETLSNLAGDRPVVLLNPRLEDVATIGIGYAGRQLRDRFLNNIQSCYYLRPLEGAAVSRYYPDAWQIWLEESEGEYRQIAQEPQRPSSDTLERILLQATGTVEAEGETETVPQPKRRGFLAELQSFLKALSQ